MIFSPILIEKIKAGAKTQTRRRNHGQPCRYKPERTYAVQPERKHRAVGRILVTDVRAERLGEITNADARREGFDDREAFFAYWTGLYGGIDYEAPVYVISFERVRQGAA